MLICSLRTTTIKSLSILSPRSLLFARTSSPPPRAAAPGIVCAIASSSYPISTTSMVVRSNHGANTSLLTTHPQQQQQLQLETRRWLNLHEYQSAQIMKDCGVTVPFGIPATTVEEAAAAANIICGSTSSSSTTVAGHDDGDDDQAPKNADKGRRGQQQENEEVVIKAQILAGGRGLGEFLPKKKNENNNKKTGGEEISPGLKGGVHIIPTNQVADYASQMLGGTLVTKQTGPAGKPVNTVYIVKKLNLVREFYFAIMMDRASQGPLIVACGEGGTSIEDLATKHPEKIIKHPIDITKGISEADIDYIVSGLGIVNSPGTIDDDSDDDADDTKKKKKEKAAAAGEQIKALYNLFIDKDCTMVEVNPLAEDVDGNLIAADAKISFDDNASFRQEEIFAQRDYTQEDPREVKAGKYYGLNYIGFDGSIGFMVNGAGLAMATMEDAVSMAGGSPANFLDVGGAATKEQIQGAFEIISQDDSVKAILVNIFGGIMRCDTIAEGIIAASKSLKLNIPIVVRLEGTNVELGKQMMKDSGLKLIPVDDLDTAARTVVALAAAHQQRDEICHDDEMHDPSLLLLMRDQTHDEQW